MTLKKTKNCTYPWTFSWMDASGRVVPCCGMPTTSKMQYGDVRKDFISLKDKSHSNLYNNSSYQTLRKSLLDGDILEECKTCRIISEDDITTDELKIKVTNLLRNSKRDKSTIDLEKDWAIDEFIFAMNNKCNLRCIYCSQSISKSNSNEDFTTTIDWYKAEFTSDEFFDLIDFIYPKGLRILNFCSLSEFTLYKGWQQILKRIKENYPNIYLCMVTNLSIDYTDEDIDAMLVCDQIYFSVDTIDEDLFSKVRVGGDIKLIQKNIDRLIDRKQQLKVTIPSFVFNVTIYDKSMYTLLDLVRYAANKGIHLNFSNLFDSPGTEMEKGFIKKVADIPENEMPLMWEIASSFPKRMKAENPKTDIILTGPFYNEIKERASRLTNDLFIPNEKELIFKWFKSANNPNNGVYLRNIFTGFDDELRGIFVPLNNEITLEQKIDNKASTEIIKILVKQRDDGNLVVNLSLITPEILNFSNGKAVINTSYKTDYFSHMLICNMNEKIAHLLNKNLVLADENGNIFIRELLLVQDIDRKLRDFSENDDEFIVWCAGVRTKFMLEKTYLKNLNIKMIVDSDASDEPNSLDGIPILSPRLAQNFEGTILICHATNPYPIEKFMKDKHFKANAVHII
jgi:MoaA/NifB/PqqE/SkfB family radical SAM enzyme